MMLGGDIDFPQIDSLANALGAMHVHSTQHLGPHPEPPELLIGIHGERIRLFHSRHYGFHQCFPAPFTVLGNRFLTLEQYMVWQKARHFGDMANAEQALRHVGSHMLRQLSRVVRYYNAEEWARVRDKIMLTGLRAKYTQNALMWEQLRSTGEDMIALSGVANLYWGNGVSARNTDRQKEVRNWGGQNRLGQLLMELREELRFSLF